MDVLLDVTEVEVRAGYCLRLLFENGERRDFDMTPYLDKRPYLHLQEESQFALAAVAYGTVVWPGDIDIAPETLYAQSRAVG